MANLSNIITPTNVLTATSTNTLTNKTWNSNTIAVAYGGTGATSLTANSVLLGNGTSAIQAIASGTSGQVLTSNGSGAAPSWQNAGGGGSAATPTALGTVYGKYDTTNNTTFVGYNAGSASSTAAHNLGVGHNAMSAITTGTRNIVLGSGAAAALTTGEGNIVLGTFGVGSGTNTFAANTSGNNNIAIGGESLRSNTTASDNIAIGANALSLNTTGTQNVALGRQALVSNTTASANTAVGYQAAFSNTTGAGNVAHGYQALYYNTTGSSNTAVGYGAALNNTIGPENVAIGRQALFSNTTGGYNTAVGFQAGYSTNTNGANTLIGYQCGYNITTGNQNTLIGYYNGNYVVQLTTGSFNIHLGTYLYSSSSSVSNEIVVGYNTSGRGANTAFIGASSGVYQQNNSSSWSTTSDFRLKKNIVDNNEGLEKIAAIRVRNFEYRTAEEVTDFPAHLVVKKEGVQLGVIAQELQQVCPDCVKEESTGVLSVDSDNVFWHMVNAIKQLKAEVDSLKSQLNGAQP